MAFTEVAPMHPTLADELPLRDLPDEVRLDVTFRHAAPVYRFPGSDNTTYGITNRWRTPRTAWNSAAEHTPFAHAPTRITREVRATFRSCDVTSGPRVISLMAYSKCGKPTRFEYEGGVVYGYTARLIYHGGNT